MPIIISGSPINYYIKQDAGGLTTDVLGIVQSYSTTGRPNPPQPSNGFDTSNTPFGNGHVFALSLGGTDSAENIVPQWEQWQQSGAWRAVERSCEAHHLGRVFHCVVTYDRAAAQTRDATQLVFENTNAFVAWDDARIPRSFQVRVYDVGPHRAAYDAIANDLDFANFLVALGGPPVRDYGALPHQAMPAEDRRYWQDKSLIGLFNQTYDDYEAAEDARVTALGETLDGIMEPGLFALHPTTLGEMRTAAAAHPGWTAPEAAGLQTNRVLHAVFGLGTRAENRLRRSYQAHALGNPRSHFTESSTPPPPGKRRRV